jgi:D-3-phosphoglycerate dehydrogenase / 2-oxoglutarate reductase
MRVLLTSTSFQDNKGKHQDLLREQGFEVDTMRGPVIENELLKVIDQYDAVLMGDDEFTKTVIEKGKKSKLKVLSKYGVGLDKVDLNACDANEIIVKNVRGVNQASVAEHVFALLLTFAKNIYSSIESTREGHWNRQTGFNLAGKKLGILGFGNIGKEVAKMAKAFSMDVFVFDKFIDEKLASNLDLTITSSKEELIQEVDILTLHLPLMKETENTINCEALKLAKENLILINTARGGLVNESDLYDFLTNNKASAYLADVLRIEPIMHDLKLKNLGNVIITPHIASRTRENVEIQGLMAVENLLSALKEIKNV